jgi:hypothetical protein
MVPSKPNAAIMRKPGEFYSFASNQADGPDSSTQQVKRISQRVGPGVRSASRFPGWRGGATDNRY